MNSQLQYKILEDGTVEIETNSDAYVYLSVEDMEALIEEANEEAEVWNA